MVEVMGKALFVEQVGEGLYFRRVYHREGGGYDLGPRFEGEGFEGEHVEAVKLLVRSAGGMEGRAVEEAKAAKVAKEPVVEGGPDGVPANLTEAASAKMAKEKDGGKGKGRRMK
jgi:hypothetical protein